MQLLRRNDSIAMDDSFDDEHNEAQLMFHCFIFWSKVPKFCILHAFVLSCKDIGNIIISPVGDLRKAII